ncbi:hypothetical protein [Hymenobacter sp. DG25A]|uniref:hypothetical protein n=1 Tax=Hymenobacter sp. DG25A TaxID=1385663 RepID=UPI0006BE0417|nr:hypothetical protein [Hymenobacter sp. DG25A]ALD22261.1 hypothetical protein AM218_14880 [Hymenobacter sp. DG25A]
MKTLLKQAPRLLLVAACASLGFTQAAQAQSSARPQPVCVDKVGDFTYLVRVSNPHFKKGELQVVRLSDKAVLYEKFTDKPVFGSKLNVKELPDGEYAFVVKVGKEVTRYTLDLHTETERKANLGSVSMTAMAE